MDKKRLYNIEGDPEELVWYVPEDVNALPLPYCKTHLVTFIYFKPESNFASDIKCPHDGALYRLRNRYDIHQTYVRQMTSREALRDYKVVRIESDGNKVLAKERNEKDPRYFIESKLSDTPKGLELMIQVGKKNDKGKKVQLFVVPPTQRLGFDASEKDMHPNGLFTEVRAIFKDSETKISPIISADQNKKHP